MRETVFVRKRGGFFELYSSDLGKKFFDRNDVSCY
jgi:hypothetical protein